MRLSEAEHILAECSRCNELEAERKALQVQCELARDLEAPLAEALAQERSFLIEMLQCDCPPKFPAECEGPTDELCRACWETYLRTKPWKEKPDA